MINATTTTSANHALNANPRPQHLRVERAPTDQRGERHQDEQHDRHRHGHRREVRRADGDLTPVDRFVEQREDGTEQHDDREADEEHVVGDEETLAGERVVDAHRRTQSVTAPREQSHTERDRDEEEADQQRTERARRERVHALQDARTREERARGP